MTSDVSILDERFEKVLKESPELRRKAVELATKRAYALTLTSISTHLNDRHGKIAGWQHVRYGSKGGYGKVTPIPKPGGLSGPTAITIYIERGHKTRRPRSPGAKGYRPRLHVPAAAGRFFYRAVDAEADKLALEAANEVCSGIADLLEGK